VDLQIDMVQNVFTLIQTTTCKKSNDPYGVFSEKSNDPYGVFSEKSNDPYGVFSEKSNDPYGVFSEKSNDLGLILLSY
jgi:hypothetical protein